MTVLFVAFEFPPLATAGVRRPMGFAKYLAEFGVTPVVVTTDQASFRQVMDAPLDKSLLVELPADLAIERVPCPRRGPKPNSKFAEWRRIFFSLVEEQAPFWKPELAAVLPRLVEKHQPKAIYVTVPPFGMGPLWCDLAQRLMLPLVLDFRDAWSQWMIGPWGSWLHYRLSLGLERRCLEAATRVVCTSEQSRRDFLRVHPHIRPEKFSVITNGYDQEMEDRRSDIRSPHGRPFTISYVGNFYYNPAARAGMMRPWWSKRPNRIIQYAPRREDWLYRSPYFFFKTVACLLQRNPDLRAHLRIRFAGAKPEWIDAQVAEFRLSGMVEFLGYLDHPKVLAFQRECDCLLVTSSKVIGGEDYSIAGKTFEYFSLCKPVLGFVAEGAQKNILSKSGMAVICNPDNVEESATKLSDLISGKTRLEPNTAFLRSLHRRELTRKLADVLREAVHEELPRMHQDELR